MANQLGNDVSKYQGDIDFNTYKNNSNFIIMKATEGNGYTDPKFSRNQEEARRVGMLIGYYHFARPDLNNSPEVEADWFIKTVGTPREGEVYVLDYEANWNGNVVGWCKSFLDRCATKLNGTRALIYLNQSQTKGYDWKPVVDAGYGLWIAAYTYDPNNNNFATGAWKFAAMQQWSNKQSVPGIPALADANVFFGDANTYKKYGYHAPVVPPPVPEPPPPTPVPTPTPDPIPVPPPVPPTPAPIPSTDAMLINTIRNIVYGKGWPWTKVSKIKAVLPNI